MSKLRSNVFLHEQGVTGDLITGHTASGAKLAGISHRRFYGTREVIIAHLLRQLAEACRTWMVQDDGGGLTRSSDESSVMEAERRG